MAIPSSKFLVSRKARRFRILRTRKIPPAPPTLGEQIAERIRRSVVYSVVDPDAAPSADDSEGPPRSRR